jgi:predicted nucleic acid-binding protein
MTPLYVETSAILRYLLGDSGADTVRRIIDESVQVLTSRLTVVEVYRTLARAEAQADVSAADAERVRGAFAHIARSWIIREMSADLMERAARPFPLEPVRSLDAIHLATSLAFLRLFPDLRVLSFDARVVNNAEALGIPPAS